MYNIKVVDRINVHKRCPELIQINRNVDCASKYLKWKEQTRCHDPRVQKKAIKTIHRIASIIRVRNLLGVEFKRKNWSARGIATAYTIYTGVHIIDWRDKLKNSIRKNWTNSVSFATDIKFRVRYPKIKYFSL